MMMQKEKTTFDWIVDIITIVLVIGVAVFLTLMIIVTIRAGQEMYQTQSADCDRRGGVYLPRERRCVAGPPGAP